LNKIKIRKYPKFKASYLKLEPYVLNSQSIDFLDLATAINFFEALEILPSLRYYGRILPKASRVKVKRI